MKYMYNIYKTHDNNEGAEKGAIEVSYYKVLILFVKQYNKYHLKTD